MAQQEIQDGRTIRNDSLSIDSALRSSISDTISISKATDTLSPPAKTGLNYKLSVDAIESKLKYGAKDSSMVDINGKQMHLYGNAYLEYEGYTLNAGYILVDFDKKEASAQYITDTTGTIIQKPIFKEKENEVIAEKLRFNFETKKGLSYGTRTKESDFHILGDKTKFVTRDLDSLTTEQVIFQEDALITTCDHEHPHFGIRTKKIKVIPNKLAIIGFSQLEIAGVPTPLVLPFGFFPLVEGQSSGLIFPDNYEYNKDLGFGLRGIGYYFPINDYLDITVKGDIYTRGTHRINVGTRYKKRYKYDGAVVLEYANNIGESPKDASRTSNRSYKFRLKHNQDTKAHPYRSLGGEIEIQTGQHQSVNYVDYNSQVQNILRSNFAYRNSLPGSIFDISVSFNHIQNTLTRKMDITLPQVSLNMQTIYPFKNKNRISDKERWYEKINVGYRADMKNFVSTTDTTLFTQQVVDDLVTGFKQDANASASFRVLKFFNVVPNASFNQIITLKTLERTLNPEPILDTINYLIDQNQDTIYNIKTRYDIDDDYILGLKTYNRFSTGVSISTQIFGMKQWSKGWLRGIRHTMKPTISFNYRTPTDQYFRTVQSSLDPLESETIEYNPFSGGAYSASLNELQLGFNYGINHFFEGKYYSKADKKVKKFQLLRQLSMNGSYNYSADSLKWSPLSLSANTDIIKGFSQLRASATYDFYETENNRRVDRLLSETQGKLMEFRNFNATISSGFTIRALLEKLGRKKDDGRRSERDEPELEEERPLNADPLDDLDLVEEDHIGRKPKKEKIKTYNLTLADYLMDFRVTHSIRFDVRRLEGRDTSYVSTHTLGFRGSFALTDNWSVDIDNISYDFVRKSFVYPSMGLRRDLHCWQMQFSWQPARDVYSFFIGVKSNSLNFLKYDYGNRNARILTR